MANYSKTPSILLNNLATNSNTSKNLFENVATWLNDKTPSELQLIGTKKEISVVKEVMIASMSFQNELFNPKATLHSIEDKLKSKHEFAKHFEKTFNLSWPF